MAHSSRWDSRNVPSWCGAIAIAIAIAGVVGWFTGIRSLFGDGLGLATMKIATALGIGLSGGLLLVRARAADRPRSLFLTVAALIALLGLGVLIAHSPFQSALALMVRDVLSSAPDGSVPGPPSTLTGIVFTAFGAAMLNAGMAGRRVQREAMFLLILCIALFALTGMLYLATIPETSVFRQLSLPAALGFCALAIGGLFLDPHAGLLGMMRRPTSSGVALRWSLAAALILPLVLGWLRIWTDRWEWFSVPTGVTVYAFSMVIAFVVVAVLKARVIDRVDTVTSSVFDAAPGALLLVDSTGVIRRANREADRLFGAALGALVGEPVDSLVPPTLRTRHRAQREAFAKEATPHRMADRREVQGMRRTGELFDVEASLVPIALHDGPSVIVGLADVTERRRAERILFESEQLFRLTFENAGVGVALVGLRGEWLRVNRALCALLGYSEGELLERTFQDVTYPDDLDADLALVDALSSGRIPSYELRKRYIRKDGSVVYALLNGTVVRDPAGQPLYYIAMVQDISSLTLTQQQLQETLSLQDSILQGTSASIITTDTEGMITSFNRGAEQMLGYRAGDVVGKQSIGLIHDGAELAAAVAGGSGAANISEALKQLRDEAARHGVDEREWSYVRRDGTHVPVLLAVTALRDPTGRLSGFLGVATDMTRRKAAEDAVAASLREKDVLLREIHHRVKNNMQVISSMLNIQAAQIAAPEVRAMFSESRERIRAMSMVHERLYRTDRVASINILDYMRDLAALQARVHKHGQAAVRPSVHGEPIELGIDHAIPLGLIANELIANAFKHGRAAEGELAVDIALARVNAHQCSLRIWNEGRVANVEVLEQSSTSFGLRLVRAMLSQIDGHLTFDLRAGVAVTVTFADAQTEEDAPA